jgi:flagellar hook-associated protein 1 FlgK
MTLTTIMNSAVSGLSVAQAGLRNTSSNIANVNTPNYARKSLQQSVVAIDGRVAGVQVSDIRRVTDDFLVKEVAASSADLGRLNVVAQFQDMVQSMFGKPEDNASIAGRLDKTLNAFAALSAEPASTPNRLAAIQAINDMGATFDQMSTKIQDLRTEADGRIADNLDRANIALSRIYELNQQIVRAKVSDGDATALEDQRAAALSDLSQIVGFTTFDRGNGALNVTLPDGRPMIDTFLYHFDYDATGRIGAETGFDGISTVRVDPITLDPTGAPSNIESSITSGAVRGLLQLRDLDLPRLSQQLSELAATTVDRLNAIHNENTGVPAPASLTGRNTGLLGTDAAGFTGQATFLATGSGNAVVASTTIDFDTAGFATIDDIVAAIQAGLGGAATVSFTDGVLSIDANGAGGATGIAIRQDSPPSDRGGQSFSHFFGMNDLVVSQERPRAITGLSGSDLHGFGATDAAVFQLRTQAGKNIEVTLDFSTMVGGTIDDAVTALNTGFGGAATFSLNADGTMSVATDAAHAGWQLAVVADDSERGTTGMSFSSLFGLGLEAMEGRASGIGVRSDIAASPSKLATGRVDAAATVGDTLAPGDSRGALALSKLTTALVDFEAAGGIGALSSSLADYARQIMARSANEAATATAMAGNREAVQTELTQRLSTVEGVNLDEELSNMIALQSAYNASARMISTVKDMFDTLLRI